MIWESRLLMTIIDLCIIGLSLYVLLVFYRRIKLLKQLGILTGVSLVVFSLCLVSLFYMADLTAMFLLPFFMPMEKAMWIMRYLHLNIHWAVSLIIVIVLGNGLVYSIRSLYPRILEYQNDLEIEKKRLEKEVEEHEQTEEKITSLGHIFERSLNEIYIFDAQTLKFILVNEGASKNLGYSMEEMRNLTPLDIKPEYTDEDFAALIEPLRTGEVDGVKFTTVHKRKDGSLYPIEVYLQLSTFGPVPAFVAIILDITMRKRAEAKLRRLSQRYEAILKAVPDVIMEVDANKVYRWANQAGHEFFGEGVIGRAASHYFKGDQETYSIVQPLFNGEEDVIYLESWQQRKDNETRLLAWWCRVLKDENGHVVGALSTARDITEHKRLEEELRILNEELELKVAERTEGLNAANKELKHFNNLFVGRELRIKELKAKVKELEGKNG